MKIYIDEVPVLVLLGILVRLPKILFETIREEIFWRRKLYPHEISGPVDFEKDWEKSMAESRRRAKRNGVVFHRKPLQRNDKLRSKK